MKYTACNRRYTCKPPLQGTITVTGEYADGTVDVKCDYVHTDWPADHPERWVGDLRHVPMAWVNGRAAP